MSIFDAQINTLQGEAGGFDKYKDKALLTVNVASKCGLKPQYTGLEELQNTYAGRGFSVIGVTCNQFGGQEPGSAEEIESFCSTSYGVSFPMTEKVDVNGDDRHPIYNELTQVADPDGHSGDIRWNFEKFVVAPGGSSIKRFNPTVKPEDPALVAAIEEVLPN